MYPNKDYNKQLRLKSVAVFSMALLILIYRGVAGSLISQLHNPPFLFNEKETFYQLFTVSYIPQFVVSNILFDIALFCLPILFMIYLKRIFVICFSILIIIYFLTYNMVTGHHYHGLV